MQEDGAMAGTQQKLHALIIAYPLQGHVIPAVHLAIKLASKGVTVTFVNTEAVHHQTYRAHSRTDGGGHDIFTAVRASGLDIRYELVGDGLPVEFDRSLHHDQFARSLLHVHSEHVEALVRRVISGGAADAAGVPPVTCLIADTFFVWPNTIAKKFGLVHVSFWTEPALVFSLYYHLDLLRRHGHFGSNEHREDTIDYIPGVAAIDPRDLTSYLQETDHSSVVHQIIFKAFGEAKGADFVLCNTVQELEQETIAALQVEKPFYAVGPVFPGGSTRGAVATSMWAESDCAHWMAARPPGSVLYVSFGSYAHLDRTDLKEIAIGVLDSGVSFVWVLRPDIVSSDGPDPLPAGFAEEARGRGVVLPWCRQVDVLSHPAVGGFLTHCGWNSVMETIWCGVPMLCFPLLTDQFTNRKLVVDDWRVGIDVGRRSPVSRGEVAKNIRLLMEGPVRAEMKKGVAAVRRALENAVAPGGSSQTNLDRFVLDLKEHVRKVASFV